MKLLAFLSLSVLLAAGLWWLGREDDGRGAGLKVVPDPGTVPTTPTRGRTVLDTPQSEPLAPVAEAPVVATPTRPKAPEPRPEPEEEPPVTDSHAQLLAYGAVPELKSALARTRAELEQRKNEEAERRYEAGDYEVEERQQPADLSPFFKGPDPVNVRISGPEPGSDVVEVQIVRFDELRYPEIHDLVRRVEEIEARIAELER